MVLPIFCNVSKDGVHKYIYAGDVQLLPTSEPARLLGTIFQWHPCFVAEYRLALVSRHHNLLW